MLRRYRLRHRPCRLTRPRIGLRPEGLEGRSLLAALPLAIVPAPVAASGLPLPGLAAGYGLVSTAQASPTSIVTVAPASAGVASSMVVVPATVPAATGPATTLSPLMNDSETAVATASEVARPRPGLSDRISVILDESKPVALEHLRTPGDVPVTPGPEFQPVEPAPEPAELPRSTPAQPVPPGPGLAPEAGIEAAGSTPLIIWDAALEALVAVEVDDDAPSSTTLVARSEGVLTAGALIAAWGGWKCGPRALGWSRRRSLAIPAHGTDAGL